MTTCSSAISPEVIGNLFVEQYYHLLHHSPEVVYKFYHDQSVVSRPDVNGVMTSTTTMKGINEMILSLGFKDNKTEIKTADAQKSFGDGVVVVVIGCLTGKDNLKKYFTQTFFLAPQDNGYFVLNDVFRYIENPEPLESNPVNQIEDISGQSAPLSEPAQIISFPAPVPPLSSTPNDNAVEKTRGSVDGDEVKVIESSVAAETVSDTKDNISVVNEPVSSTVSVDAPKKSYASIASSASKLANTRGKKGTAIQQEKVYVPTHAKKASPILAPEKAEKEVNSGLHHSSILGTPETSDIATENNNQPEEGMASDTGEGHSVYIRNLPYEVTVANVKAAFEKFGLIKTDGIQVRCHMDVGHCFGFVEFETEDSMIKAIEASPVNIGGRQVIVEQKRTTRRAGMPSRFFQERGYSQNDIIRGRGNFSGSGGSRANYRNEYGYQGGFSNLSSHMPPSGRGDYQRGRGKFGQSNGQYYNPAPIPT